MSDLLLDTCALLWLADGAGLSKNAISSINNARFVYVSSISAWEISLLHSKEQLEFSMPPEDWFNQFIQLQNIKIIDISSEISFMSNKLPWWHKDPADRFIIATAIIHKLDIVTADKKFRDYPIKIIS